MSEDLKVCRVCHYELPISEFALKNEKTGNRRAHCRACENARVRAFYASNEAYRQKTKERAQAWGKENRQSYNDRRKFDLKIKYGMTPEQWDQILADQNGRCALCKSEHHGRTGRDGQFKRWMVDHCHETGKVRGLLCHKCNTRLGAYEGLMKDIGEAAVIAYITRESPVKPIPVEPKPSPRFVEIVPPKPILVANPCSVDGCTAPSVARGLCSKHYGRFVRRNGDVGTAENLPRNSAKGSSHPKSKLTAEIVLEIRSSSEKGVVLAQKYGVTPTLISNVRNRRVWNHLNENNPSADQRPEEV